MDLPAFGFANSGVTCYWNSVLQCFLSLTKVTKFLRNKKLNIIGDNVINVLNNSESPSIKHASILLHRILLNHIKTMGKSYSVMKNGKEITKFGQGQEDANEGFVAFLDAFEMPELDHMFMVRYRSHIYCNECQSNLEMSSPDENVFIKLCNNDFDGDFVKMLKTNKVEIEGYRCTKCSSKEKKIKMSYLTLVSEVIVIVLEKYGSHWAVDIPKTFEIPSIEGPTHKYNLVALTEHTGSTTSGHYWAKCLRKDGPYTLNDTSITKSDLNSTPNTYLAWFECV